MPSQLSPEIESRPELADAVRHADQILMPMLRENSQAARAVWGAAEDAKGRRILTLALSDPWGFVSADFAEEELRSDDRLRKRFYDLVGDMISPRKARATRTRIEIRDAFATVSQVETLRLSLGQIPGIERANLQLHNRIQLSPGSAERMLITDFAVEVDDSIADDVRRVVEGCGFFLRRNESLFDHPGVREAVGRLVEFHLQAERSRPEFAICFGVRDPRTVHLLELSTDSPELGIGRIEGFGFDASGVIPYASELRIYLMHPNDLRLAYGSQPGHRFFVDFANGDCEFFFPDDGERRFRQQFPEIGT